MKKITNMLITAIAIACLSSSVFAIDLPRLGFGGSMSITGIDASGTETDTNTTGVEASDQAAKVSNNAILGSYYAELSFGDVSFGSAGNGVTFGYQATPGDADVSAEAVSRADTISVNATAGSTSGRSTYKAQATVGGYETYYMELPIYKALYVKAGQSSIDVTSKESATTNGTSGSDASGTYGNTSVDGSNFGIGLKGITASNIVWKIAYEETNFDAVNLTSTTGNKIKADIDTVAGNISLGYRF